MPPHLHKMSLRSSVSFISRFSDINTYIAEAGGLDCDMENANSVVDALKGKTISEVIAQGKVKLSSVPSGGSAPAAAAPSGGAAPKGKFCFTNYDPHLKIIHCGARFKISKQYRWRESLKNLSK